LSLKKKISLLPSPSPSPVPYGDGTGDGEWGMGNLIIGDLKKKSKTQQNKKSLLSGYRKNLLN